jgi:hypothetical protein
MPRDPDREGLDRYLRELDRSTRPAWTYPEAIAKTRRVALWMGGARRRRRAVGIVAVVLGAAGLAPPLLAGLPWSAVASLPPFLALLAAGVVMLLRPGPRPPGAR